MTTRKAEGKSLSFEEIMSKKDLNETMKITSPYDEYLLDKEGNCFILPIDDLIKLSEDSSYKPEWFNSIYEWAGICAGVASQNIILLLAEELKRYKNG